MRLLSWRCKRWEVDEFLGENHGLIVAEIELKTEDEGFRQSRRG